MSGQDGGTTGIKKRSVSISVLVMPCTSAMFSLASFVLATSRQSSNNFKQLSVKLVDVNGYSRVEVSR